MVGLSPPSNESKELWNRVGVDSSPERLVLPEWMRNQLMGPSSSPVPESKGPGPPSSSEHIDSDRGRPPLRTTTTPCLWFKAMLDKTRFHT